MVVNQNFKNYSYVVWKYLVTGCVTFFAHTYLESGKPDLLNCALFKIVKLTFYGLCLEEPSNWRD